MPNLSKHRRIKRPTVLVKRSLPKKNGFNKRSYKPLYEKLKANNHALAKALSKEKQESQYLFSQNISLTSEVQELGVACNRRDDVIARVLKDAKESLQLLLNMSTHLTNTIASCQQVATTTRFTPRKSTANNRRDSTRRMSGKSPARGVVQPMVSGHTITKPTINLSRLNIQRQYRVQDPPNLSDIDEALSPEQSPSVAESTTPVRNSIARSLNYGTRRIDRLPDRLQGSMRVSDENERRSRSRNERKSNRRSRVTSERLSDVTLSRRSVASELQTGETLRSPRVELHDVSRLLHNSQTVNIRTLLENSSDMDMTQPHQPTDAIMETTTCVVAVAKPDETTASSAEDVDSEPTNSEPSTKNPPSQSRIINNNNNNSSRSNKWKGQSPTDEEDPLEGPSWLLNVTSSFVNGNETATNSYNCSSRPSAKDHANNHSRSSAMNEKLNDDEDEDEDDDEGGEEEKEAKEKIGEEEEEEKEKEEEEDAETAQAQCVSFVSVRGRNKRPPEQTHNDVSQSPNANRRLFPQPEPTNFYRHQNPNNNDDDEEPTATVNLCRFVTRKRGSVRDDDDDDYTLLWKRNGPPKNYNFDLNDLELPILESPIVVIAEPRPLEPEPTTNIQRFTHNFGNYTAACPTNNCEETIYDHTGLVLPVIAENLDTARSSAIVEPEEHDDDDDAAAAAAAAAPRKRKRNYKKKIVIDESDDDSDEWIPQPKTKIVKNKRKITKTKDPSTAKVVLQKLNDNHVRKSSSSPESRRSEDNELRRQGSTSSIQQEVSSDSDDASNASSGAKLLSGRPRRQKAPMNLKEPSLGKKLRRK